MQFRAHLTEKFAEAICVKVRLSAVPVAGAVRENTPDAVPGFKLPISIEGVLEMAPASELGHPDGSVVYPPTN